MTAAFDRVCQSHSAWMNGNDAAKEKLALIILRHVDECQRDPERLADVSFREWAGIDPSSVGVNGSAGR